MTLYVFCLVTGKTLAENVKAAPQLATGQVGFSPLNNTYFFLLVQLSDTIN